jgi:S-formylglutathione hydrolase FrmB
MPVNIITKSSLFITINMFKITFRILLLLLFLLSFKGLQAAKVDTVETYSPSMQKSIKAVVVTPNRYNKNKHYPVLYMLHGYGGNYADWVNVFPVVKNYADEYEMILVCVDGKQSWYLDSPVDKAWKYETYVSTELVQWIDKRYSTITDKAGRGIMGLSMGGHGALYLSFKHTDIFGAAGSMSGGVDFRPFPDNWNLADRLGKPDEHPENWDANTVINLIPLIKDNYPALLIDCGTKDFFYKVNLDFHAKLLESNVPHDFIVRDGGHEVSYWLNAIHYQLLFMHLFFNKQHL